MTICCLLIRQRKMCPHAGFQKDRIAVVEELLVAALDRAIEPKTVCSIGQVRALGTNLVLGKDNVIVAGEKDELVVAGNRFRRTAHVCLEGTSRCAEQGIHRW